jgi:hypothetical protein
MNSPAPNSADEEKTARDILFEDHPNFRHFSIRWMTPWQNSVDR